MVGTGASTPALTAQNDGATCPNAVSPYVPTVDDESTSANVDGTSATRTGQIVADNNPTTPGFCSQ